MSQLQPTAGDEWKAHWPLVASAMIGMSFYTVITYSFGTFIGPVEKEFGWSRTEISLGITLFSVVAMLGGPFVGALIDKLGTRRLAIGGMILSIVAFAAFSQANGSLAQWFTLWVVYGICALLIKTTIWSVGVSSVFTVSRGLALAAVLSGSALGQTFAPLLANQLIIEYGWRGAYSWLGFGWGGLALLLITLFFFDARELGKRKARKAAKAQKKTETEAPAPVLPGLTLREAFRDSRIIRIGIANVLMSLVGSGVSVHLVQIIAESGPSRTTAVGIAATAGIAGIIGKFFTGWLLDRSRGSFVPFFSFAIAALGHLLLLNLLDSVSALTAGAMILGYASGAGLQVTAYLISRYAGLKSFGAIFGTISSTMMAGMALGPLLAGYIHDVAGDYSPLLMIAMPTMIICAFLFVGLGAYPDFKNSSEEPEEGSAEPKPAQ